VQPVTNITEQASGNQPGGSLDDLPILAGAGVAKDNLQDQGGDKAGQDTQGPSGPNPSLFVAVPGAVQKSK
jgi:hypothetical protein